MCTNLICFIDFTEFHLSFWVVLVRIRVIFAGKLRKTKQTWKTSRSGCQRFIDIEWTIRVHPNLVVSLLDISLRCIASDTENVIEIFLLGKQRRRSVQIATLLQLNSTEGQPKNRNKARNEGETLIQRYSSNLLLETKTWLHASEGRGK